MDITRWRNAGTLRRLAPLAEGGSPGIDRGAEAVGRESTAERESIQR